MLDNPGASEPKTPSFEIFVPAQTVLPPSNARLGVLGGAYNPITRAHLLLARYSKDQFKLHEIIFVLPKTLPNKPLIDTSIEQRLEMMRLGTTDVSYVSLGLCTHGLFLDICAALQKVYPQSPETFFITGRDAAERILNWPYPDSAQALAHMFARFQLLVFVPTSNPPLRYRFDASELLVRCLFRNTKRLVCFRSDQAKKLKLCAIILRIGRI